MMKNTSIISKMAVAIGAGERKRAICLVGTLVLAAVVLTFTCESAWGDWQSIADPPDVNKAGVPPSPTDPNDLSCWMAAASNLLAAAGYGNGGDAQAQAEDIYQDMVTQYGIHSGGFTEEALNWWLGSANNLWPANPYKTVRTFGPSIDGWHEPYGLYYLHSRLRAGAFLSDSIWDPVQDFRHAITVWGDNGHPWDSGSPASIIVTDSDKYTGTHSYGVTWDNANSRWDVLYEGSPAYIYHAATLSLKYDENYASELVRFDGGIYPNGTLVGNAPGWGALDAPDSYVSDHYYGFPVGLGRGGSVTLRMAQPFHNVTGNDLTVFEVGGSLGGSNDSYRVYVSADGNQFFYLGSSPGDATSFDLSTAGLGDIYQFVRIEDTSFSNDGADIDAVWAVPEPATLGLLLLGGLTLLSRRKG